MIDYTQSEIENNRPEKSVYECINFCLSRLYKDRKHRVTDEVVNGMTFEELIGALLLAKDEIEA